MGSDSAINFSYFFQAEDGIRDLVRSRGLGDVYKRQVQLHTCIPTTEAPGFFPPATVRSAQTNWAELYDLSLIHI